MTSNQSVPNVRRGCGSQRGTRSKKNEGNRPREATSFTLILPFCHITLCSNRGGMEGQSVGQHQSSWSTEKRELEPTNEKGEEIPREDRQHICT